MDSAAAPRVSVIVRTKDRPRLLGEALESLRAQTFTDFEAVVVNDGGAVPEGLGTAGRGIRVVTTQPPHGRSRALNAGLAAARGRFVAYLDDDDLWLPPHLETLERFLSGTDAYAAAYTDVTVVLQRLGADGRYADEKTLTCYDRPFDRRRLLSSNTIPLIGLMHERALALAIGGFDEEFDLFEDWDFLIRLSEKTRFHRLPGVTAVYRLRDDGTNATIETPWHSPRSEAARLQILRKYWGSHTPETQAALVDALNAETEAVRDEVDAVRRAAAAQRADCDRELAAERANAARLAEQLAEAGRRIQAVEESLRRAHEETREANERTEAVRAEAALVRADAARQLQASGERETAWTARATAAEARAAEFERHLQMLHRSLVWRLFTPYWKLKSFLGR